MTDAKRADQRNEDEQEVMRKNGAVVFDVIATIGGPASVREVVETIATHSQLNGKDITKPVREALENGYRCGVFEKRGYRYFVPLPEQSDSSDATAVVSIKPTDGRKRRGRSNSRGRKGNKKRRGSSRRGSKRRRR